jgi:acetyltransferase-like isoleucine patch superfamily enzyme
MKKVLYLLSLVLPWRARLWLLSRVWHYEIHPTARIGLSWIMPVRLILGPHASIGHFTLCKGVSLLHMGTYASIGNGNWITGYPENDSEGQHSSGPGHFAHQPERRPQLIVEEHAAITNRHIIDCTSTVRVGRFATVAGFNSQILTHSIDLEQSRQSSAPITIGEYCFVGTNVVILGDSVLPPYCVLGAKSLLNKRYEKPYRLYAGVPSREVRELDPDLKYFQRPEGFVV